MPRVINLRSEDPPEGKSFWPGARLVDRRTVYGNRFKEGRDGTREECVTKHMDWLCADEQANLRKRIRENLKGCDLLCWCHPLACHADNVMLVANTTEEELQELIRR